MKVLVRSGGGLAGSHVADRLRAAGLETTDLDDLSTGYLENVPAGAWFVPADGADAHARFRRCQVYTGPASESRSRSSLDLLGKLGPMLGVEALFDEGLRRTVRWFSHRRRARA